ncbi:MAG: DUF2452 domain-containing protein [Bacteroidota bacterium]
MKNKPEEKQPAQFNPIDKDKITEVPHILPYSHSVGGAIVKPEDKGKIKGRAIAAMNQQTEMHLDQIREQIELLAKQAQDIQHRVQISEKIYLSDMPFEPVIGHLYHLYEKAEERWVLSMLSPEEWGRSIPYISFLASVKLLADHTWEIVRKGGDE